MYETRPAESTSSPGADLARSGYVLVNRLVTPLAGFVLLIFAGQRSDTLMAEYALVMTWYFVLQTLPLLGLSPFVMREASRHPRQVSYLFSTVGTLAVGVGVLVNVGAHGALRLAPYSEVVTQAIGLVALAAIPGILAFLIEILLISLGRVRPVALVACAENGLRAAVSAMVIVRGGDVVELAQVLLVTRSLAVLAYFGFAYKHAGLRLVRPRATLLREIRRVLPVFSAHTVLVLVLSRLDFFMLSFYAWRVPLERLGHYAVAYRLYEIGMLVVSGLCTGL